MADETELHAFFDRDVFYKLACCDLWKEVLTAFGVTHPYRLASAGPNGAKKMLKRKGVSDELQTETVERVGLMMEATPVVPEEWSRPINQVEIYNKIKDVPDIGSDDALQVVTSMTCPFDNILITGDKRLINKLSSNFPEIMKPLEGRIITFEACLLKICEIIGFEAIRDSLIAARECDGTLKIALGSDNKADAETFCAALRSFNPI
jgi:hypothetical protein